MSDLTEFVLARTTETERECDQWVDPDPSGRQSALWRRTLAAMRKIVELHREGPAGSDGTFCVSCVESPHPCPTLRALAYVHADHHDFQREWAH